MAYPIRSPKKQINYGEVPLSQGEYIYTQRQQQTEDQDKDFVPTQSSVSSSQGTNNSQNVSPSSSQESESETIAEGLDFIHRPPPGTHDNDGSQDAEMFDGGNHEDGGSSADVGEAADTDTDTESEPEDTEMGPPTELAGGKLNAQKLGRIIRARQMWYQHGTGDWGIWRSMVGILYGLTRYETEALYEFCKHHWPQLRDRRITREEEETWYETALNEWNGIMEDIVS